MIAEDQPNRGGRRRSRVEELQERDQLARATAILDEYVDLAGHEVDAGEQAQRAMALVFVIAPWVPGSGGRSGAAAPIAYRPAFSS